MLHEGIADKSDVIPVKILKDGVSFDRYSGVIGNEDYKCVSEHVNKKIREFGKRILQGDISVNPYEAGNRSSCTYCDYRSVCGYDEKIPGYSMRKLNMNKDAALEAIRNESNGN